jgi:hypothetical protein
MAKHSDHRDVVGSLEKHKLTLETFRERVNELKRGVEFRSQEGNRLYYSVDFSEIYSYLHYDDPKVHHFGVSLFATGEEGRDKLKQQHYLALTHLFQSLSKNPLYLLQPYVLEMYSYARGQAHKLRKIKRNLSTLISSYTRLLKPEHVALLRAPEKLTEEQKIELLQVLKEDYPQLSIDLLEFERWHTRTREINTRGQLLKELLANRTLSHRTDEILKECGIRDSELEKPSIEEENKVVEAFPELRPEDEDREFSRLVDARALLLLRNMNRLLERRNARLVLITRDAKSPMVAEKLKDESWFDWTDVKKYFYGIEAIYLDLILQTVDDKEKLAWLIRADSALTEMVQSVDEMLNETSTATEISAGVRNLLAQHSGNWNQLVDVEFIRTSGSVDWLGKEFVSDILAATGPGKSGERIDVSPKESSMLQQLATFVDSPDFQEVATEDANKLWDGIAADIFGMNKLSKFSEKLNEVVGQFSTLLPGKYDEPELFRNIIENSRSFLNMPTIHFENKLYEDFVKNFQPWRYKEEKLIDKLGQQLAELFAQAASNFEKPENCLFIAFVMGMLDFWDQALEVAEYGSERIKEKRSEFDYFLAYARYRSVDMHGADPLDALQQYIHAHRNIVDALRANPYDARYLKRRGTITLRYHYATKKLGIPNESVSDSKDIASEDDAIGFLKQAVKRAKKDDRKTRVRALNNLAFAYGTSEPPRLEEAEECIKQIEKEFDEATNEPENSLPDIIDWPFVMDTIWYIGAKIAYARRDAKSLKDNAERLQFAVEKVKLLPTEEEAVKAHISELQELQNQLASVSNDNSS